MTKDELSDWEQRCGFRTQAEAAAALGVPLRTYQGWHLGRQQLVVVDALLRSLCPRIERERVTLPA